MFTKLLIANRGEIACRVITTARRMGIATVAVYSDADRHARHVQMADESVHIGAAPSGASYLRADRIIAACQQTGAQAVHPGYGFLSENADFARRVQAAGVVFIGPPHQAIAAMGDKITAKRLAAQANVHTIPGCDDAIADAEQAVRIARSIGYPVMIKASAGGGGRGLRVASNDKEAREGFTSCQSEARSSFGDARVFIEKFITAPRHIEIQVLGDAHGNMVFLHERECSLQRRHQKLIEEAPSPFIAESTRIAMGRQAVALAQAVGYQSAGTVEFVVAPDQAFYFLEMNTRLQVEHPVTEAITGLDLVEQMIRIAAGETLPFTQADVRRDGWAIECRINAEDPLHNFLPSTGRLVRFQPPAQSMWQGNTKHLYGVRVDTGVEEGGEISMFYDPMIAKLIVHGRSRSEALAMMREALNGFVIRGIHSNILFQAALVALPQFMRGDFHTGFVAEHFGAGFDPQDVPHGDPAFLVALAAYTHRRYRERASTITGQLQGHALRLALDYTVVLLKDAGSREYTAVRVEDFDLARHACSITVCAAGGDRVYAISSHSHLRDVRIEGLVNGQPFTAQIERGQGGNPLALRVIHQGRQIDALVLSPRGAKLYQLMPGKVSREQSKLVRSPMPGLLINIAVQPGQRIQAGEKLAVIEAMKMENILSAPRDGMVRKVHASLGDSLAVGDLILEFV